MSTSGTYTFNLATLELIEMAFQESNIYSLEDTIEDSDYQYALKKLNLMLKAWEVKGIRLWKRRQGILFPDKNTYSYQLGAVSGSDNATLDYVNSTLSAAASLSAASVTVTSASGFSISMYIGIELDTGSRHWTTISNVAGSIISLTDVLPSAAADQNTVVAYTSKINRPLQVIRANTLDLKNNNSEVQMQNISYDEYFDMPLKTTIGRPCNFYYDRLLSNSLPYTGTMYLFPCPDSCSTAISFSFYDTIQDMVNSNDTPDLPQEWLPAIMMGLAADLCGPYGKAQDELPRIAPISEQLRQELESWDSDCEDLNLGIKNR